MIRHIVLFGCREEVEREQIDELIAALQRLPTVIPEIRRYEVRYDEVGGERSATFGLLSEFDDWDALQRYREHPDHQAVLTTIRALTSWTKAWDYTV